MAGRQNRESGRRHDAHHAFFTNRRCEHFPCHDGIEPEAFNCLFCYCPLYTFRDCGGRWSPDAGGYKDCSDCRFPHMEENYGLVLDRLERGTERLSAPGSPESLPAKPCPETLFDIVVLWFPAIANLCDLSSLYAIPEARVRMVRDAASLGRPDLILIPGSLSTMSDLLYLRLSGVEEAVREEAGRGTVIFGICGGYQMLGERIVDEAGIEAGGELEGMGLLPIETVFAPDKQRTFVNARVLDIGGALAPLSGMAIVGYEMHFGNSCRHGGAPALTALEDGSHDGCWSGNVYGSYLHGFFDTESIRQALIRTLRHSER